VAAFALVRQEAERATAGSERAQVVVAARDLEPGITLTAADVVIGPVAEAPPAALASVDLAIGHTTVTPFLEGEVIALTRLAEAGGPLTVSLPPGLVGMTVAPDSVPQGLAAGDRVDVLATFAAARPYTSVVAEGVGVIDVAEGEGFGGSGGGTQVMLVLDPATARSLAQAQATGTLAIAVRGYVPLGG
jgi:Flp pilus assembly protein CpaB